MWKSPCCLKIYSYICEKKKQKTGMDILLYILALYGLILCFAFVGAGVNDLMGSSHTKKWEKGEFEKWYMKLCEENRKRNEERLDEMRYNDWLYEHRPKKSI